MIYRFIRYFQNLLICLLIFALLIIRTYYFRPITDPWAEDGVDLIFGSLQNPWGILIPIVDAPALFARAITLAAVYIDLPSAPQLIGIFSILTWSFAIAYFLRDSYSWLISSKFLRTMIVGCFVFGAGSIELIGTAIGTLYLAPIFLLFLILEKPLLPSKSLIPLVAFLAASSSFNFIVLPLLFIRYLIFKEKIIFVVGAIILTFALIPLFIAAEGTVPISIIRIPSYFDILSTVFDQILAYSIVGSLFPALIGAQSLNASFIYYFGALLFFLLFCAFWRIDPVTRLISIGVAASTFTYALAHELVRSRFIINPIEHGSIIFETRHGIILTTIPLLAWTILFSGKIIKKFNFQKFLTTSLIILHLFVYFLRSNQISQVASVNWKVQAQELLKILRGECITSNQQSLMLSTAPYFAGSPFADVRCHTVTTHLYCTVERGNNLMQSFILKCSK